MKKIKKMYSFLFQKNIIFLFQALITVNALSTHYTVPKASMTNNIIVSSIYRLKSVVNMYGVKNTIIFIALFFFYKKTYKTIKNIELSKIPSLIISIVLSILNVMAISMEQMKNLNFIFQNKFQFLYSLIVILGYLILINRLFNIGIIEINKFKDKKIISNSKFNKIGDFLNSNTIIKFMAIIIVCWMPYIIARFPGVIGADAFFQLNQYFKGAPLTSHFPVFSTFFVGTLVRIGKIFGENNSIFLVTVINVLFNSFSFAYAINYLRKKELKVSLQLIILGFFSIFPLWPYWATRINKDSLYFAIFLLFVVFLCRKIRDKDNSIKVNIGLCISSISLGMFRNEGVIIALIALVIVLAINRKKTDLIILVVNFGISVVLLLFITSNLGVEKGSKNEMMTIPFQCTARYVKQYKNEVTPREKKAIGKILNYEKLETLYKPHISDPIKGTAGSKPYNPFPSSKEWEDYFTTWFRMGIKHPRVYLEAIVAQTHGYYLVYDKLFSYAGWPERSINPNLKKWYNISFESQLIFPRMNLFINSIKNVFLRLPIIGLLGNQAVYFWIFGFAISYILSMKKWTELIVSIIVCFQYGTVFLSPIDGSYRYVLPLAAVIPFLLFLLFLKEKKEKPNE
ncbi:MAG: DUF6020 family protein [Lachnospiraceae bacterium]|jgi:hypothetical protein|nr:DUF6020 family protein [Lachnospiraceae bacterium]